MTAGSDTAGQPSNSVPAVPGVGRVLFDAEQIGARVRQLGQQISEDYRDTDSLLVVGVLKGSFIFLADLVREMSVPAEVDFMKLSSYNEGRRTSGTVRVEQPLKALVRDRDVLIVEDIVDSGLTLRFLRGTLGPKGPRSLRFCSLLARRRDYYNQMRSPSVPEVNYVGFEVDSKDFVVGYGLDHAQGFRNLRDLRVFE